MVRTECSRGERCDGWSRTWLEAGEAARYAEAAVVAARERLRVARARAADRLRLAESALAARQEAFALGLRDAADAHAATARAIEASLPALERRRDELLACADHLRARSGAR